MISLIYTFYIVWNRSHDFLHLDGFEWHVNVITWDRQIDTYLELRCYEHGIDKTGDAPNNRLVALSHVQKDHLPFTPW